MHLDEFELREELGRGATARVCLARYLPTGEDVCLKLFHPPLADSPEWWRRVSREAEVAARLSHPNIIRLRGLVEGCRPPALAMDYVDGLSLEALQPQLPFVLPEVSVWIVVEILKALAYAHGEGVVHRDLKPANVLVGRDGRVYVTDFGLARVRDSQLTALSSGLMGSVDYMAPEQVKGERATPATDVFAAGSVLYFLLTGTRPFSRATAVATLAAIAGEAPEAPQRRNPKVSAALSRHLLRALEKDPASRWPDADSFRGALERYLDGIGLVGGDLGLARWLGAPAAATVEALETAAEHLESRATASLAASKRSAFLEDLSHLTLKAPESPAIGRLMAGYRRGRRRRKAVWASAGAAAAVVVWLAAMTGKPESAAVTEPPKAVAAPSTPKPAPAAAPKRAKASGRVRFEVGDGVTVYWDGRKVDPGRELRGVSLGEHFLLLEREGFDPIRAKVAVKADEPTVIKVQ